MVRSLTVLGVCRVLCHYWEMVTPPIIRSLLLTMIRDLAYDVSSDNVRVAVLQVRRCQITLKLMFVE